MTFIGIGPARSPECLGSTGAATRWVNCLGWVVHVLSLVTHGKDHCQVNYPHVEHITYQDNHIRDHYIETPWPRVHLYLQSQPQEISAPDIIRSVHDNHDPSTAQFTSFSLYMFCFISTLSPSTCRIFLKAINENRHSLK